MALKLIDVYKQLVEQFPVPGMLGGNVSNLAKMSPSTGQPSSSNTKNIVELADVNTIISIFPEEKKLVFSPQDHTSYTKKLKLYVDVLKQNFMIDSINPLEEGVFEIVLDPRESFESVVRFLQPQKVMTNV